MLSKFASLSLGSTTLRNVIIFVNRVSSNWLAMNWTQKLMEMNIFEFPVLGNLFLTQISKDVITNYGVKYN